MYLVKQNFIILVLDKLYLTTLLKELFSLIMMMKKEDILIIDTKQFSTSCAFFH